MNHKQTIVACTRDAEIFQIKHQVNRVTTDIFSSTNLVCLIYRMFSINFVSNAFRAYDDPADLQANTKVIRLTI